MTETVLSGKNRSTQVFTRAGGLKAVDGVSFSVERRQSLLSYHYCGFVLLVKISLGHLLVYESLLLFQFFQFRGSFTQFLTFAIT